MKNWAIVIGINDYDPNSSTPLKYARQDAELIRDFFHQANFEQVWFFSDQSPDVILPNGRISTRPTFGNLTNFLHHQFKFPFLSTGDNCWFFFAGHGERYQGRDYLMPQDCTPEAIERTGISVNYVRERLLQSGADNVILILDACRTEGDRSSGVGNEPQRGVITISACKPTQKSWEIDELQHGAFTYALHEAFRIPGERNCATIERLNEYLRYRVPDLCRQYCKIPEQIPQVAVEPIEKLHFILFSQYVSNTDSFRVDLLTLKNDAYRATADQKLDLAEQIWRRVLGSSGYDEEAIKALQDIALKKAEYHNSLPRQSVQKNKALSSRDAEASPKTFTQSLQLQSLEDNLTSEKGIDYRELRDLLYRGEWKQADRQTSTILCNMADRISDRWLRVNDVALLPKQDLATINQLWTKYSLGKFGFSVQKQIWKACGSPKSYGEDWNNFGEMVGWYKDGQPNRYGYSLNPNDAPRGHFPRDFAFSALDGGTARGRADFPISLTAKLLSRTF